MNPVKENRPQFLPPNEKNKKKFLEIVILNSPKNLLST
jgi:hypothetical protein